MAQGESSPPPTTVTLTGTGVPHPAPGRAGAGTLVRHGDVHLQFDAGRGTVIRLEEAGTSPYQLSAQFVTHVHSDHLPSNFSRHSNLQVHSPHYLLVVVVRSIS